MPYNNTGQIMTAYADSFEGLVVPRQTKTGSSRDFIGFGPPNGEITQNATHHGERKVAVIAVADQGERNRVIESYSQQGYSCVPCESDDDWAKKSNLFFSRQSATLVTDDLDLIWQVRLHDLKEGTSVLVHALVHTNEVLQEAQAIQLGATEIFETDSEPETISVKDLI